MATIEERLDEIETKLANLTDVVREALVMFQKSLETNRQSLEVQGAMIETAGSILRDVEELKRPR